jgi:O-antigen ligase
MKPITSQPTFPKDPVGRLVGWLLLTLLPLVTLVPVIPVALWLTQDWLMRWLTLTTFLLCLGAGWARSENRSHLTLDLPDFILILLSGWILLSVKNSKQAFDSFYSFKSYLTLLLWWWTLRSAWKFWPGLWEWFERVFFWTSLIASAYLTVTTSLHGLFPGRFDFIYPRAGLFPNENIAAGFLGMALIWFGLKKIRGGKVSTLPMAFLLLSWGLTESRGGLVSMILAVVFFCVLHMEEIEDRMHRWGSQQWVFFGLFVLFLAFSVSFMINRLFHAMEMDPRAFFRLDVWSSCWQMALDQPLWGFGPGTFQSVYPSFRADFLWNTTAAAAHNEYLQVAAECGWPALGITVLFLWSVGRQFWETARRTPAFQAFPPSFRAVETAFYVLLFECAHNFVDFTFHEWSHRLVILSVVTFALSEKTLTEDLKAEFHFSLRAFLGGSAVLLAFLVWCLGVGSFRDYNARMLDVKAYSLFQSSLWDKAEVLERKALVYRSNDGQSWNLLGVIQDGRAGQNPVPEIREKLFHEAQSDFLKAIDCSPYELDFRDNQIQSLIKRGHLEEALSLETQLLKSGPRLPMGFTNQAMLLLRLGRAKEAIGPAQQAIDNYPNFLPAYLLKAEALERCGKRVEALLAYQAAQDMLKGLGVADPSGQVGPNIERLKKSQ